MRTYNVVLFDHVDNNKIQYELDGENAMDILHNLKPMAHPDRTSVVEITPVTGSLATWFKAWC